MTLTILVFLGILIVLKFTPNRNFDFKAPLMSGVIGLLLILYFFGGVIWNRIRVEAGAGYLGFVNADDNQIALLRAVTGPIILAALIPYIIVIFFSGLTRQRRIAIKATSKVSYKLPNLVIVLAFFFSILGEGLSIFQRENYLISNGIPIFLRLSGITNLVGIALLGSVYLLQERNFKSWEFFLLISWFILLLGKGSRSALLPLALVMIIVLRSLKNWKSRCAVLSFAVPLFIFASEVIFISRERTHGIFMIPSNIYWVVAHQEFNISNISAVTSKLLAALFTTVITIPMSIGTLDYRGIIANANPLISNMSLNSYNVTSDGIERIFPYTWVPTSSAGTIYGAIGGLGLFAIFFVMASANIFSVYKSSWSLSGVFFKVADLCFFFQILFLLEYSTRIWFRVFWAFWLSFFLGIFFLALERYNSVN